MPSSTADPTLAAIRLVVQLNSRAWHRDPAAVLASSDVVAHTVTADDAAHHVIDPDTRLGLDPLHANDLAPAMEAATLLEPAGWVLALPRPGHLGGLRGPVPTNTAAVSAGAAVVGRTCGAAWVPSTVGPAVQWTIHPAAPPIDGPGPSETERALSEALVSATRQLQDLDVAGGDRPGSSRGVRLPKPYDQRRQRALDRALGLHLACLVALDTDGGALSSFAMEQRRIALAPLVGLTADVVVAVCSTPPVDR